MPRVQNKRKRVVLTLFQKMEILEKLKSGRTQISIAQEYGIGAATVYDIKKAGPQIKQFSDKHLAFRPTGKVQKYISVCKEIHKKH